MRLERKVLSWEKPQKIMTTEEWKSISADCAPPGVYTPNMSEEDMFKWKAKLIGKKAKIPRVEIRKSFKKSNNKTYPEGRHIYAQVLIIVSLKNIDGMKDCKVVISTNGKIGFSLKEVEELNIAIKEAQTVLENL